jgi:hypothetical protein
MPAKRGTSAQSRSVAAEKEIRFRVIVMVIEDSPAKKNSPDPISLAIDHDSDLSDHDQSSLAAGTVPADEWGRQVTGRKQRLVMLIYSSVITDFAFATYTTSGAEAKVWRTLTS